MEGLQSVKVWAAAREAADAAQRAMNVDFIVTDSKHSRTTAIEEGMGGNGGD